MPSIWFGCQKTGAEKSGSTNPLRLVAFKTNFGVLDFQYFLKKMHVRRYELRTLQKCIYLINKYILFNSTLNSSLKFTDLYNL